MPHLLSAEVSPLDLLRAWNAARSYGNSEPACTLPKTPKKGNAKIRASSLRLPTSAIPCALWFNGSGEGNPRSEARNPKEIRNPKLEAVGLEMWSLLH